MWLKKLEKLTRNLKEIEGTHELSFEQLFPPEFVSKHSRYPHAKALFDAAPFNIESQEDFENLDPVEMD